jgi:hypothetical protein
MRSDQAPTYRPCRSTSPASRRPGNRPGDRRRRLRDGEPRRADPRLHHVSPTPCTTGCPNSDPTNAPRSSTPAACGAGSGPALTPAASRSHPPIAAPPRGPTERQATRPAPALLAGDPNDKVTAAWVVAQAPMAAYANPDRVTGRLPRRSSSPPPNRAPSVRSPASAGVSPHGALSSSPGSITPACPTARPNT